MTPSVTFLRVATAQQDVYDCSNWKIYGNSIIQWVLLLIIAYTGAVSYSGARSPAITLSANFHVDYNSFHLTLQQVFCFTNCNKQKLFLFYEFQWQSYISQTGNWSSRQQIAYAYFLDYLYLPN